ncbi:MAG: glycosyltransferase family 4 protein [Bdellovibrionales bacterium]|nr:glycosyltransferase family 4 protein [Bdellovibrionales bacterium]
MDKRLVCLIYPDVYSWEKEGFEPLLNAMTVQSDLHYEAVTRGHFGYFKAPIRAEKYWIICRDWKRAVRYLKVRKAEAPVYISVLGTDSRPSLLGLMLQNFLNSMPSNVHLVAHSPINYRFFREIAGLEKSRITLAPLAVPPGVPRNSSNREGVTVGTLVSLTHRCNLHYFLSVAHYVANRNPDVHFKIFGTGALDLHFGRVIQALGLGKRVRIEASASLTSLSQLDVFLFTSLQNEHFISVLGAASYGLPVLCSDVPGAADLITDGHTGFLTAVNDTKPMAELLLRLVASGEMRVAFGQKLREDLQKKYSCAALVTQYEKLFFGEHLDSPTMLRAASE